MILRRSSTLAAMTGLLGTLVSCSASGPEQERESQRPTTTSVVATSTTAAAPAVGIGQVATAILTGGLTTTSQRVTISVTGAHVHDYVQGSRTFADGKISAFDLDLKGGTILDSHVIGSRGRTYAQFRTVRAGTDEKYAVISSDSRNADVRQLASLLSTIVAPTSPDAVAAMVRASPTILKGPSIPLSGSRSTVHYSVKPELAKLTTNDYPGRDDLLAAGVRSISVELYVDQDDRPVRIDTVAGQGDDAVTTSAMFDNYNKPVTVKPPDRSETAGD